ncbi:hypothetical protein GCM10023189_31120 [Nibrella saemangeumensis]|uniref:Uncharacterized protein n=1 Tax=Nibrella saemangeumensis TaxID=1084526 RepID=A0ABP8N235_9BACT
MATPPPNDTSGSTDHLALRYLRRSLDTAHPADEPFVMNDWEHRIFHQVKRQTVMLVTLLGTIGLLLLYLPQFFWPDFFSTTPIPVFNQTYEAPLITILYGILLVYLEVYLLIYVNLRAIRILMALCQFPRAHDPQYERHLYAMTEAAVETDKSGLLLFGQSPYFSLPRWGLTIFFLYTKLKAALSTYVIRLLLRQLPGGYALPAMTNSLVSIPVFAVWNIIASVAVIHEARIRIMAPSTIRGFVDEIHEEWGHNEQFCSLIPEALSFLSIQDRQFNYAHLLFTEELMDRFGLDVIRPKGKFLEQIGQVSEDVRRGLERLIVFGALIDGRLSRLEKRRLRQLKANGWLTYKMADIKAIGRQFNHGQGLWV